MPSLYFDEDRNKIFAVVIAKETEEANEPAGNAKELLWFDVDMLTMEVQIENMHQCNSR